MAKIPLYQSKERLASESPEVRVSPQAMSAEAGQLAQIGATLTEGALKIQEAYDHQQVSSAELDTLKLADELKDRATKDGNNTSDLSSYSSEIFRRKQEILKGIGNPKARADFEMKFDLTAGQTLTQIKGVFWNRMKEKQIANMSELNTRFIANYANDGNDKWIKYMDHNIDQNVAKGFIGADYAQKVKQKNIQEASYLRFQVDLANDRKQAEENLKSDKYGLDVETSLKAKRMMNKLSVEVKNAQKVNAYSTFEQIQIDPTSVTHEDINAMTSDTSARGITVSDAKTLHAALDKHILDNVKILRDSDEKAAEYIDIVSVIPTARKRYDNYQKILKYFNDGKLSADETKDLETLFVKTDDPGAWDAVKSGIDNMNMFFANNPVSKMLQADTIKTALSKISKGEDIKTVINTALKTAVNVALPGAMLAKDTPNAIATKSGVSRAFNGDTELKADMKPDVKRDLKPGDKVFNKRLKQWVTITSIDEQGNVSFDG
jgi:hypothetical protein